MTHLFLAVAIWLPMVFGPQPVQTRETPQDLRIDTIPMSDLDRELARFGIPRDLRVLIIMQEREERKPGAIREIEDTQVDPAVTGPWIPTICSEGQGCAMVWKAAGAYRSRFLLWPNTSSNWSRGGICEAFTLCTIVSRVRPGPGQIVGFQGFTSLLPVPIPLMWDCF